MSNYLDVVAGIPTQKATIQTSAGATDADKIISLDATGRIDNTMLPVGLGADVKSIVASEDLSQGDFVNVWDDAGTPKVRKADASAANAYVATGFILQGYLTGVSADVYFEGVNTGLSGLTIGEDYYLSDTAGGVVLVPTTGTGNLSQRIGTAISATEISFERAQPIVLA